MPTVEVGKCSAEAVEKAFWRERIWSAFDDSRACCWVADAFCIFSAQCYIIKDLTSYLCSLVKLEGSLARGIEVSVAFQRVVLADKNLCLSISTLLFVEYDT